MNNPTNTDSAFLPDLQYPLNSVGLYKYIEISIIDLIIDKGELIIK